MTATTDQTTQTPTLAAGLRALADFIEANPQFAPMLEYSLEESGINGHLEYGSDKRSIMAEIARKALRAGAKVEKDIDDMWHNLVVRFGTVRIDVLARRGDVCERVVVGTETVTKRVPDPEKLAAVPRIEVTETVEKVEWRCSPLLASTTA